MRLAELAALTLLPLAFSVSCGKKKKEEPKNEIEITSPTNPIDPQNPTNPPTEPPLPPTIDPPLVTDPPEAFMHPIEGIWQNADCMETEKGGSMAFILKIDKLTVKKTFARFSDKQCKNFVDEWKKSNQFTYKIKDAQIDLTSTDIGIIFDGLELGKTYYTVFQITDKNTLYFGESYAESPEKRSYKMDYEEKWLKLDNHPSFNVQ